MSWTDALMAWLIVNELVLLALLLREIRTPDNDLTIETTTTKSSPSRGAWIETVASRQHHLDVSAAATSSGCPSLGVAADDPSSELPPFIMRISNDAR